MNKRTVNGFFYGLFMDVDLLQGMNIRAVDPRPALVDGYALQIGARATLVPSEGRKVYGMVIAMTHADLEKLYGAPGLNEYRPEAVLAQLLHGEAVPALCYNLLTPPHPDEVNEEYAFKLRAVLAKLNFPSEYIESVL
ncbi:MAG: gamma-glutamylcyclotransferase [Gammaproteobacteria bacterium]|nr:gamma-glutamylcyclotransferase [Gammaproteobacteria bacterium]